MEHSKYTITINAPREKVWNTLFDDETYRKWTAAFAEGSQAETDWKKGSKAYFTDGNGSGMVSRIEDNKPNEFMSIRHLGTLKDGVEDYNSEEAKKWGELYENYTLNAANGGTELVIDLKGNLPEEFKEYFAAAWPKALDKLKELSEEGS